MADLTTKPVLSACVTVGNKLPDLAIKNGQLIFVRDKRTIAFDFGGERVFYNQIEILATEEERISLITPVAGIFYFVIDTAVLWTYQDNWIPLTTPPKEIIFIGTELPELGMGNSLYVDTANSEISIWNSKTSTYEVVADKTKEMSAEDIDTLFQKIY